MDESQYLWFLEDFRPDLLRENTPVLLVQFLLPFEQMKKRQPNDRCTIGEESRSIQNSLMATYPLDQEAAHITPQTLLK